MKRYLIVLTIVSFGLIISGGIMSKTIDTTYEFLGISGLLIFAFGCMIYPKLPFGKKMEERS